MPVAASETPAPPALTAADTIKAFDKIARKIGPKASWHCGLSRHSDKPLYASFYATEFSSPGALFAVEAETLDELVGAAGAGWEAHCDEHRRRTIRDMALAIIRITDEFGRCSDQMLRVEFSPGDVRRFGEEACARASEMASRGPFKIVATTGSNADAA